MESNKRTVNVPRYVIDLDLPADQRWNEVIDNHKEELKAAQFILERDEIVGPLKMAKTVLGWFKSRVFYIDELRAIAKRGGLDLDGLVILQLVYEACAHCTSIVVNDSETNLPLHIRTMDWELELLRPLTIEVEFVKNSETVAIGTTWVGYLGILTGMHMRNQPYSVSVNFRVTGDSPMENLTNAITGSWPIGFLLREVLTSPDSSFEKARANLTNSALIAPVYFTMAGSHRHAGCIITRNRKTEENPIDLDESNLTVIQTNCDHWSDDPEGDIMDSIARRERAREFLQDNDHINGDAMWNLMGNWPIKNGITVYGTIMIPSKGIFETRLPIGTQRAFNPKSETVIARNEDTSVCRVCGDDVATLLNAPGSCLHPGDWHSEYDDCSYVKCGLGLGIERIGKQHWACCYSTDQTTSKCPKSKAHVFD